MTIAQHPPQQDMASLYGEHHAWLLGWLRRRLGCATYTEGKMTHTSTAALTGKTIYGTPKWKANLGGDWSVPGANGLGLNARLVYTGSQYVNSNNTQGIDSWTRVDLGAAALLGAQKQTLGLERVRFIELPRENHGSALFPALSRGLEFLLEKEGKEGRSDRLSI